MKCPECPGEMVKERGCISEPIADVLRTREGEPPRRVRPVVFWSCYNCGHCEEVGRGIQR